MLQQGDGLIQDVRVTSIAGDELQLPCNLEVGGRLPYEPF